MNFEMCFNFYLEHVCLKMLDRTVKLAFRRELCIVDEEQLDIQQVHRYDKSRYSFKKYFQIRLKLKSGKFLTYALSYGGSIGKTIPEIYLLYFLNHKVIKN